MEWIKAILQKHKKEDGTFDLEAAMAEINTEFPKQAVPKDVYNQAAADLKQRDKDLSDLKKSAEGNEDLKEKYEKLQTKYNTDTQALNEKLSGIQLNSAIEIALTGAKARNIKAVRALLDSEKITLKDGELEGLDEQLKAVKEENPYLFGTDKKQTAYNPASGNTPGAEPQSFQEAVKQQIEKQMNGDVD
ncbi:phage scaffolding protein [Bacillaceae bacterium Marseille-Q3522]|nr:phage scaffolding protein [Bacillaceae bacterium Marseille-Q3522]